MQQDESVEEKAADALPADVLTGLVNANWKERLAAMEKFLEVSREIKAHKRLNMNAF